MRGLIRDSYADFGPMLACETLRERHDIKISPVFVCRIIDIPAGCTADAFGWAQLPGHPEAGVEQQVWSEPVQIDGSDHAWFHALDEADRATDGRRDRSHARTRPNRIGGPALPLLC